MYYIMISCVLYREDRGVYEVEVSLATSLLTTANHSSLHLFSLCPHTSLLINVLYNDKLCAVQG